MRRAIVSWNRRAGTGNFVGGTTALDDATVIPTAVYVNTPCVFAPYVNPL